jgi:lysozyme
MLESEYLDAIKKFVGFAPTASWDYKQHSNGYGTRALYPGETIDRDTAEQRFQAEIAKAAAAVDAIAPNAPPGARAALTSLTYNAGPGWTNSGLGELVRAGDWTAAAERLQQYNKAGGQVLPGLQSRRSAEAAWFGAPPQTQRQAANLPPTGLPIPPQVGPPLNLAPPTQAAQPAQQMAGFSLPQMPGGGGMPQPEQFNSIPAGMPPIFPPKPKRIDLSRLKAAFPAPWANQFKV